MSQWKSCKQCVNLKCSITHFIGQNFDIGKIYHLDYSENMSQQYKYEPRSSHFIKMQFSLHCTVKQISNSHEYIINQIKYIIIYHLSDKMTYNYVFKWTMFKQLIDQSSNNIYNCPTLYKSKYESIYVFKAWHSLETKIRREL